MKHVPNNRRPRRPNGRRGGGGNQNVRNQTFESNGPEGRIRGTAQQVLEKYLVLARDASSSGEHIQAEAFYQHAEHYFRVLNSDPNYQNRQQGDNRRPTPADNDGGFSDDDQDNSENKNQQQPQAGNESSQEQLAVQTKEPAGLGDQPDTATSGQNAQHDGGPDGRPDGGPDGRPDGRQDGGHNRGPNHGRGRNNSRTIPIESPGDSQSAAQDNNADTAVAPEPNPEATPAESNPESNPGLKLETGPKSAPAPVAEVVSVSQNNPQNSQKNNRADQPAANAGEPPKRGRGRPKKVVADAPDKETPASKTPTNEDVPAAE